MGLADSLRAEQERGVKKGPLCSVCVLISQLPKADAEALMVALEDPAVQTSVIFRALRNEGFQTSSTTIGRHRKRECRGVG